MSAIEQELRAIAATVFDEKFAQLKHEIEETETPEAEDVKRRLAIINAIEQISIGEAALLLGCSDGHIRNLVKHAKKGQAKHPIPFLDLDGTTAFDRLALLEWARAPKGCEKALRPAK